MLLVLLPRLVLAQTAPVTDVPPGEDVIVVVKKGDPAPFTGQLFDNATSLRWGNWLLQYKLRLKIDVEYIQRVDAAELEYQKKLVTIEQTKYLSVTTELQKTVTGLQNQLANPPFYQTFWFGMTVGVALSVVAVGFVAWGVSSLK